MATDSINRTLVFEPIPAGELRTIRAAGVDEAGNRLTPQADTEGGNPLRCCLRETRPGERVLLLACTPPGTAGPTPSADRFSSTLTPARATPRLTATRLVYSGLPDRHRPGPSLLSRGQGAGGRGEDRFDNELIAPKRQ